MQTIHLPMAIPTMLPVKQLTYNILLIPLPTAFNFSMAMNIPLEITDLSQMSLNLNQHMCTKTAPSLNNKLGVTPHRPIEITRNTNTISRRVPAIRRQCTKESSSLTTRILEHQRLPSRAEINAQVKLGLIPRIRIPHEAATLNRTARPDIAAHLQLLKGGLPSILLRRECALGFRDGRATIGKFNINRPLPAMSTAVAPDGSRA
jgi:hypothetical protein